MVSLYERVLDKVRTVIANLMIKMLKELAVLIDQLALAMV